MSIKKNLHSQKSCQVAAVGMLQRSHINLFYKKIDELDFLVAYNFQMYLYFKLNAKSP